MGITAFPLYRVAAEWGWNALGPVGLEERRAPSGYVTGRMAMRIVVSGVIGGAAFGVGFLGPQFLVRPLVAESSDYARTSLWTFMAVALLVLLRRRLAKEQ